MMYDIIVWFFQYRGIFTFAKYYYFMRIENFYGFNIE